jgi:hypothetical protein
VQIYFDIGRNVLRVMGVGKSQEDLGEDVICVNGGVIMERLSLHAMISVMGEA